MRTKLLTLALLSAFGCRATAPTTAAEPETVGSLTESYHSIAAPAPVRAAAPVVEASFVAKEASAARAVEASEESAPEVVSKGGGITMTEVR